MACRPEVFTPGRGTCCHDKGLLTSGRGSLQGWTCRRPGEEKTEKSRRKTCGDLWKGKDSTKHRGQRLTTSQSLVNWEKRHINPGEGGSAEKSPGGGDIFGKTTKGKLRIDGGIGRPSQKAGVKSFPSEESTYKQTGGLSVGMAPQLTVVYGVRVRESGGSGVRFPAVQRNP